jgi:isoleucyl-tRNA synthetase
MHKSWGNAIWFDDAIETIGADVMRWMYASAEPSRNFGFGYTPATDVKRKILTWWNTYSFFVSYANIEEFIPSASVLSDGPARSALQPIDRWALALTQRLIADCTAAYEDFDTPHLVRLIERYWDDLSNWYVRLSRARFYGGTETAAFETLWYCLAQLTRATAPLMPFLADEIWINLAGSPNSVHLAGFPTVDGSLTDERLLAEMETVRAVVELGRAARANANLKTRQPLREVIVATQDVTARAHIEAHRDLIATELNVKEVRVSSSAEDFAQVEMVPNFKLLGPKYGKDVGKIQALLKQGKFERHDGVVTAGEWKLEGDEFEARTRAREGFAVADGGGFAVALDTEITPELALEGRARDVIRQIQDMRKDSGFELTDRIRVTYPADLGDVFGGHGERISAETLAVETTQGDALRIEKA